MAIKKLKNQLLKTHLEFDRYMTELELELDVETLLNEAGMELVDSIGMRIWLANQPLN